MKTSSKILALFALAALAATSLAQAADPTPAAPAAAPTPAEGPRPGVRKMMAHRLEMLTEKLNLTEDQRTKIKAIWKQSAEQGKALRDDAALAREDRRAKIEASMKAAHEQVRAVLTVEQQAIFDKLPADGPGREGGEHRKSKDKDNS